MYAGQAAETPSPTAPVRGCVEAISSILSEAETHLEGALVTLHGPRATEARIEGANKPTQRPGLFTSLSDLTQQARRLSAMACEIRSSLSGD